jgi:death-on-curing protein
LARPQNAFTYGESDIVVRAIRLLVAVGQGHAFVQGNKRTCFVGMVHFLNTNGYDLAIEDSTTWADQIIALVEHHTSEEEFVHLMRPFVVAVE